MAVTPQLFLAKVMHKRLLPRINAFVYRIYYFVMPLSQLDHMQDGRRFSVNRRGIMSFWARDHGPRDGTDLEIWVRKILNQAGLTQANGEIMLIAMPRIAGYGFNPVSFWLCLDSTQQLRAVLCEVHNTFKERHSYLCAHEDQREITGGEWLEAKKMFHVSPFFEREGHYRFRFDYRPDQQKLGIWIDYYNARSEKHLLTSLVGRLIPYSRESRRAAFWSYPLVTVKTIGLIHWQALKLILKGIRYIPKPDPFRPEITNSSNLTKNLDNDQLEVRMP